MKNILMVGQFSGPQTGERIVNVEVKSMLIAKGYSVKTVDSCVITKVDNVGYFSINKIIKAINVFIRSLNEIRKVDILYATPGQTVFGVLRFLPLIILYPIFKKKVFLHWHGYGIYQLLKNSKVLKKIILKKNIINIYLTEDLHSKMTKLGKDNSISFVLKNFTNVGLFKPKVIVNQQNLNVLYMGSLIKNKGINQFVESSLQNRSNLNFHVAGVGSDICLKKVLDAESKGCLTYHGEVSELQKKELLKVTDIFVLQTSYSTEGVPLALLEAMGTGCAIITTPHNGIPETIADSGFYLNDLSSSSLDTKLNLLEKNRNILNGYKLKAYERSKQFQKTEFEQHLFKILESK